MRVKRLYAYCCAQGGGRPEGCLCSQPEHDYAYFDVRAPLPGDVIVDDEQREPDGWIAAKVNSEGGIVAPFGPMREGPDAPADPRYTWVPFYCDVSSVTAAPSAPDQPAPSEGSGEVERERIRNILTTLTGPECDDEFAAIENALDHILATPKPGALQKFACRFDSIEYSRVDLVIAQRAACAIVPLYGTGDHGEQKAAREGKLWHDHPAVQGALRALHEARIAGLSTPVPATTGADVERLREALEPLRALLNASEGAWPKTPWKVVPSDGKPIIASDRGGNLFRGYIATWQEADLIVGVVNSLPAIFAALAQSDATTTAAGEDA